MAAGWALLEGAGAETIPPLQAIDVPPKKESNYDVSLEGQKGGQTVSVLTSRRLVFVLGPLDWSQQRILLPNCTDHRFVT